MTDLSIKPNKMAKAVKKNRFRMALQGLVLAGIAYLVIRPLADKAYHADFEAYCPFGGLQALSSYLANNSLACSMTTTQIAMGLALVVGVFLFSKLFCSYLCPIGMFTEWLGRLGTKMKMNFVIRGVADRLLRNLKYALLFVTFYFSVSSSELFCKTFDPYYAVFSGFSSDVVVSYAVLALLLAIPGSFFVRQFWCKYLCPLSAASNVFSFGYLFAAITALYLLLTMVFGLTVSWVWLLAALSLAGVATESFRMRFLGFPLFRITRNHDTCTSCRLCDKACPMAIKISDKPVVNHIDCHLCGDCIASCPEKDTLQINRRNLGWLPAAVTVLLVAGGLVFSAYTDIPTVNLRWGSADKFADAGIYEQSGLKSVKCYGSSMSFANHMKELPGVLGVETFVGDHRVKVFYDKSVLTDNRIREAIFSPVSLVIAAPEGNPASLSVAEAAIDQFFDPRDAGLLATRFGQHKGIMAMQTVFGEPVHALIYYDKQFISVKEIGKLIEEERVQWTSDGETFAAETDFIVASLSEQSAQLSLPDYLNKMYEPVEMGFNAMDDYKPAQLDSLEVNFPGFTDPDLTDMPWYLLSHLSNDKGVVKFSTLFTPQGVKLRLLYVRELTNPEKIMKLLNSPELNTHMSDGTTKILENPYRF